MRERDGARRQAPSQAGPGESDTCEPACRAGTRDSRAGGGVTRLGIIHDSEDQTIPARAGGCAKGWRVFNAPGNIGTMPPETGLSLSEPPPGPSRESQCKGLGCGQRVTAWASGPARNGNGGLGSQ